MAASASNTSNYKLNHTMLRVKDPKASVKFYEFIGMTVIKKLSFPDNKFDLYFLAYDSPGAASHGASTFDREGLIELTHNYGTENDANFTVNNGNKEPHRGFGHVCISVDHIQACCDRIEKEGYKFQKKLTDGRMRNIAFALDPDGYWVEIVSQNTKSKGADDEAEKGAETDVGTYRMNHTMIRVKDAEKSLKFYTETLGMTLLRTSENKDAGFNLYFLGYGANADDSSITAHREGLLELTWNYGTEKDADFKYHDGNAEPQGFGHICISVDNLDAACARFDQMSASWKKRLTDGRMKNVAFLLDPDGYWVEVVQNERFAGKENF